VAKRSKTAGEKIMLDFYGMSIEELRAGETQCGRAAKDTARQIDAAIRRAVKEAFDAGRKFERAAWTVEPTNHSVGNAAIDRIMSKYRVKL
jgi:hypothetical protein